LVTNNVFRRNTMLSAKHRHIITSNPRESIRVNGSTLTPTSKRVAAAVFWLLFALVPLQAEVPLVSPPTVRNDPLPIEPKAVAKPQTEPALGPYAPAPPVLSAGPAPLNLRKPAPAPAANTAIVPRALPNSGDAQPLRPAAPSVINGEIRDALKYLGPEFSTEALITRTMANEPVELHAATAEELNAQRTSDLEELPLIPAETATLDGVRPGVTAWSEALKKFGEPRKNDVQNGHGSAVFNFPPFERAEVAVENNRVMSITVKAATPLDQAAAAKQLDLEKIRPVTLYDDQGSAIGLAYAETGVLLCYAADGKSIEQILLEPVTPETFLLRAEQTLLTEPRLALLDIESVLVNEPRHARANWLKARLLGSLGHWSDAFAALATAQREAPSNAQYQLTSAEFQGKTGSYADARSAAEKVLKLPNLTPLVRTQAEALVGDLYAAGPKRDYKRSLEQHLKAVKSADALTSSKTPATRRAAKQVLLEAYLGIANDIAWGFFQQKDVAVPRWLQKAEDIAKDLQTNEGADAESTLTVARQALAACAGTQGLLDPTDWSKSALLTGKKLITNSKDPWRQHRIQWEVAQAMYDSLQADQARGVSGFSLANSALVVKYLEQGAGVREQTEVDAFMLGRLYYRIGAIFAIDKTDHKSAVYWYAKAVPLINEPLQDSNPSDWARHGETFVSIGLSYWEAGRQDRAIQLTEQGVDWMQRALKEKAIGEQSLAVPYSNLASMHKARGNATESRDYEALAGKLEKQNKKR
jgi:hypothetical protein